MDEISEKIFHYISSSKPHTQVGLGLSSGWLTGYLIMKMGKLATALLGSIIIILKIAEIEGAIHIDWPFLQQKVQNISRPFNDLKFSSGGKINSAVGDFSVSFVGGFLIGVGSS